jgi:tetratricopeptide (TPR) repeat protein/transcriptional regulator with XRE-family HTH domain
VRTLADLARVLRELRRRHARRQGIAEPTYRELAGRTGWSHGIIGEYLSGRVLPPTDRFDTLIRLLGATPAEQGALATARDRVEESRRRGTASVPRQLPLDVYGFTGREREIAELDALLGDRSVAVISAVSGTAGVGKTALAVRWAHQVAHRFPDGQLYLDLRGYDPERPIPPAEALAGFLRALGVDNVDIPAGPAERAARYRTELAGRRVLVVLDNAPGPDQVRALLPGGASCFTLVTSRDDLAGLVVRDGARRIELDTLPPKESVNLLRTLVGARVDADPAAAAELAECCAGLPLALRIAAEADRPLAHLVADLRDERRRLDLLDTAGDPRTAVRSVFSWSYRRLSAAGARAFGLLGLHPGRDIDAAAVAALSNVDIDIARSLIEELARAHLIEPSGPERYRMHDLLRAYAAERAGGADRAALSRLFDHYLETASAATAALFPHDRPHRTAMAPEDATRWLDAQRANLVAVALHAAKHGWPGHSVGLSSVLWRHFEVGGHYQEALAVHTSAADAARETGQGRAETLANLGGIHWWLGDFREALACFEQSLAEARDPAAEARALARLGVVHERLGEYREALFRLRDALTLYRGNGNRHGEGVQLINIGALYRRLGRYPASAEHERWAATLFAELGDLRLEGYALGNLGAVESLLGHHDEALAHLAKSLENCRRAGDRGGEASALGTMGAVYQRLQRHAEALDHLHRALALSRETGDRSLETETLNTLGETLCDMGETESSLARHRAALALTERTGDRYEQARALAGIAAALDDPEAAREARDLYRKLGVPFTDRAGDRADRGRC